MAQTKKPTSVDEDTIITSEQKVETKEVSDKVSATKGTWEEPADPQEELNEKMVYSEGTLVEGEAAKDFVQALQEGPTEAQNPSERVAPENEGIVGVDFFGPDDDWKATVLGETPQGSTLQIMKRKEGAGYYLAYREGLHRVPKEIQGWFTNYDKAEQAGRTYLNRVWEQQSATAASA